MIVKGKYGFWVEVPEGNGFDQESFRKTVGSHLLEKGYDVFVPAFAELQRVTLDGDKRSDGEVKTSSDKKFGVVLDIEGEWWDEVYRKRDVAEAIINRHYGLKVESTSVRFKSYSTVVFIKEEKLSNEGIEGSINLERGN